jgi:transaldolase / glucose-6-phosphate isomerase
MDQARNPLRQLQDLGQSVWLDYIRRHLLGSAEFRRMLDEDGLRGMTSNPTIFEKAIAGSTDYDEQLRQLAPSGKSIDEIYEALSIADIQMAADALRPIYDQSEGRFGYVSYEVSPLLANETQRTIVAARRYADLIGRPNVMIKVPSTPAGIPAIEQLISEGRNINVTLMFSMRHYEAVAEAYIRGLERRAKAAQPVDRVASVASVFVSRMDTLVDKRLEDKLAHAPSEALAALLGTSAVANAKLIYQRFKEIFRGDRFRALREKGARVQQPLWASTGTKNPHYSDIKYVQDLIGPDTVNTMPPQTMDAFRDHGKPKVTVEDALDDARRVVARLKDAGIDLNAIGEELQDEGVKLFAKSFDDLRAVIKGRRAAIVTGARDRQQISVGAYDAQVKAVQAELDKAEFPARLWRKDPTLWKKEPAHQEIIRGSLGWLTVAEMMAEQVSDLVAFANEVRSAGYRDAVLLGMGGSSLCPELFRATFPSAPAYPRLHVLDSTVPDAIKALDRNIDVAHTLFVVSTKSGGTIETLSHFRTFFEQVKARALTPPGMNFVGITDPGTALEKIAHENKFRRLFLNPHDIGGRYSALSYFGLVPAALIGMDLATLLDRAIRMMHSSAGCLRVEENVGVSLGAVLGALKKAGRDKVTFIVSPPIAAFGLWVEQLIAESTGKEGTGLVPICDEPLTSPESYGSDRIFAYLRLKDASDSSQDRAFEALRRAGIPTVLISVADKIDVGEEFLRWEIATATVGAILGIDAFDQPNVQESKDNTSRLLAQFEKTGKLSAATPVAASGKLGLYLGAGAKDALKGGKGFATVLRHFFELARPGDYFATMAYVAPSPMIEREVADIRRTVLERLHIATTFGYGPRFLHSTGQLHKGGPNTGLFLQITQDHRDKIPIPGAPYDFGILNEAQYLGDFESLESHGRRVMRIHLGGQDPIRALGTLKTAIAEALKH